MATISGPPAFVFGWALPQTRDTAAALSFVRHFKEDRQVMTAFRSLLVERGRLDSRQANNDEEVINQVARLLVTGELIAVRQGLEAKSAVTEADQAVRPETAAAPVASAPIRTTKTWVEFQVVDMEDNPVSGKRFQVMLPDGKMEEGVLGQNGTVRFNNIDPGNCVFVMPELDRDAWEKVD